MGYRPSYAWDTSRKIMRIKAECKLRLFPLLFKLSKSPVLWRRRQGDKRKTLHFRVHRKSALSCGWTGSSTKEKGKKTILLTYFPNPPFSLRCILGFGQTTWMIPSSHRQFMVIYRAFLVHFPPFCSPVWEVPENSRGSALVAWKI